MNSRTISIGTCRLGDVPRIALAIGDDAPREEVAHLIALGVDLVELRIDRFKNTDPEHVLEATQRLSGFPRIGTIRCQQECGEWQQDETARLALFKAILPEVEAVDVELNADAINRDVIACARDHGRTIIGSFHDFEAVPDTAMLTALLKKGSVLGVDIVKIAAHCHSRADLCALAGFLAKHHDQALIVIGMGLGAAASRILFPAMGSLITYTFLGAPSAPGQLNCDDTVRYVKALCSL